MNNKLKGLILETVSEVLLEGRLEDVKAKYPEDESRNIDALSKIDPSGNNKYLAWMANQYITVGQVSLNQIEDIIKRFHTEQARINPNMAKEVVEANPSLYPGKEAKRVSSNPKDISSYSTVAGLTKVIEAAEENQPSSTERDKIYQDDKWTVIVPKTHQASCKYGVHSNWCVSTSNSHYYKNYTDTGMLAFVLWRGKQEGQMEMSKEGEYKVAAYIKYDRPEYRHWEWYNKKDNRMDNDLVISILPPALIQSIQNHLKAYMKSSGYLIEIDVPELEEKSMLLSVRGDEGRRKYYAVAKKEYGLDWAVSKYDRRNRIGNTSIDWTQTIPFIYIQEPSGELTIDRMDMNQLYRALKSNVGAWRERSGFEIFKSSLPYSLRNDANLSDEKLRELMNYVKQHFSENYKGYIQVATNDLQVGDYVRWERATRNDRRRYGTYKQGKILRQTPTGYFVVDIDGEDKPSRFKPDYGKYMDKRYEPDNLDMTVWDYVPQPRQN